MKHPLETHLLPILRNWPRAVEFKSTVVHLLIVCPCGGVGKPVFLDKLAKPFISSNLLKRQRHDKEEISPNYLHLGSLIRFPSVHRHRSNKTVAARLLTTKLQ